MIFEDSITQLQRIIDESRNMVFFGGAGVSTESGIPDFRSADGLYYQSWAYPPETILSSSFFKSNPAEFYRFYRAKMIVPDVKPNAAHLKLVELEAAGKLKAVVTQNIDGLHQLAGSKAVYELHGSVLRNYCMNCRTFYSVQAILDAAPEHTGDVHGNRNASSDGIPYCVRCGGMIKPDVVLYEEALDTGVVEKAVQAISAADTLIIGGTSLAVYPAASLIDYFRGTHVVLINKSATHADARADLCIADSIGAVLGCLRVQ